MIRSLLHRLEALERQIIARGGPWPPEEHTFSHYLWDAIGRPGERHSFSDMYQTSSRRFWEGKA